MDKQVVEYSAEGPSLDEIFKYRPTEAEIFPTLNCSLDCEGCNLPAEYRKNWKNEDRYTIDWWLGILAELEKRGIEFVMIMGGEPFSYRDPETGEGLERMIQFLAESKSMAGGLFTDAVIPMISPKKLEELLDHGLLKLNIHSSVDFLPDIKEPKKGTKNLNRAYKAWYGLNFLTKMAEKGACAIANCVISPTNINKILPLYKELRSRGIMLTLSTLHWNVHVFGQGRDPERYKSKLTIEHQKQLVDVIDGLIEMEKESITKGRERTLASSSRCLRAMSTLGIDQSLGCLSHSGKVRPPGVIVVGSIMAKKSGGIKYCPCMVSESDISRCPGCLYGFRDRDFRLDKLLATMGIYDDPDGKDFPNIVHPKILNINFAEAIDLHVHVGREEDGKICDASIKRAFTPEMLMEEDLKAVVVKEHFSIPQVPSRQKKVFSSITLNDHVPFEPDDVSKAIKDTENIRIVYFPTFHCKAHEDATKGEEGYKKMLEGFTKSSCKPLNLLWNKKLKSSVKDVIDVILDNELIVATGHVSWEESYAVAEYVVSKKGTVIVTHPFQRFIVMPLKAQKELGEAGAWIERCAVTYLMGKQGAYSLDELVKQVVETGVHHNFISTDSGQYDNPGPRERLQTYAQLLFANGISEKDLKTMLITNPNKILFKS